MLKTDGNQTNSIHTNKTYSQPLNITPYLDTIDELKEKVKKIIEEILV